MIVVGMAGLFGRIAGGEVPSDIAGPVGIYAITTQAARFGFVALINFVGIFSINLAILNMIPFPPLDGWRLLVIIVEAITRKKIRPQIEQWVQTVGMVILMLLLLLVTFADVRRLVRTRSVEGFLNNIVEESTP
jgi:regulator of sigma E protease